MNVPVSTFDEAPSWFVKYISIKNYGKDKKPSAKIFADGRFFCCDKRIMLYMPPYEWSPDRTRLTPR